MPESRSELSHPAGRWNELCWAGPSSSRRTEYPIKGQDSKKSCFGGLPVPTAVGIRAGEFLVSKHFHRLGFGKRHIIAFSLKVDIVAAVRAFEDDSIG